MVAHLRNEAQRREVRNIDIVCGDFLHYRDNTTYDWVIALGVLEYVVNPSEFMDKILRLSHKWVMVTLPTPGIWGKIYRATSRLSDTKINLFKKSEIRKQYASSVVHLEDVGLKSRVCSGMTLTCLIEKNQKRAD
jgi:hypothetical protein